MRSITVRLGQSLKHSLKVLAGKEAVVTFAHDLEQAAAMASPYASSAISSFA
jgi:hypothetical protein